MLKTTWLFAAALFLSIAGCNGSTTGQKNLAQGYLATDACSQHVTASACDATERGCRWVTTNKVGVCVSNDACLSLGKAGCGADATCAWSAAATLCPVGASCADGGYCHTRDAGGTDCACVSPISSNAGGTVPAVECDCSGGAAGEGGGMTGSGGACACACPACAPGEICPPCACNCDDGGEGCSSGSTCACACGAPPPDGGVADPCVCNCNDQGNTTTVSDVCSAHADSDSCTTDTTNHCGVVPGPGGAFVCAGAIDGGAAPICPCAPGSSCNCPTNSGGSTCAVPPAPGPTPIACPAIACANLTCTKGLASDSSGCPTCACN
ncbi:MAG: hypothetical protein ABI321_15805 [Polyangia bacterium]